MELGQFELTSDAVFYQLKHFDTGVPLADENGPVGVMILGSDTDEFKKHRRKIQNRSIEIAQAAASGKKGTNASQRITAEELDEESLVTLSACISEIKNISWKGARLEAPTDNRKLLDVMPWAAEQIDAAIGNRKLFMPALSKVS
jgi:hypothetical protein